MPEIDGGINMSRMTDRENLMKMVYEMEMQADFTEGHYSLFTENVMSGLEGSYFRTMYDRIEDHLDEIDDKINELSVDWKTSRMPSVDLAILRVASAEILYAPEIPDAVSINEAVKMAKKYSTEKSSSFINGILGALVKNHEKD